MLYAGDMSTPISGSQCFSLTCQEDIILAYKESLHEWFWADSLKDKNLLEDETPNREY